PWSSRMGTLVEGMWRLHRAEERVTENPNLKADLKEGSAGGLINVQLLGLLGLYDELLRLVDLPLAKVFQMSDRFMGALAGIVLIIIMRRLGTGSEAQIKAEVVAQRDEQRARLPAAGQIAGVVLMVMLLAGGAWAQSKPRERLQGIASDSLSLTQQL